MPAAMYAGPFPGKVGPRGQGRRIDRKIQIRRQIIEVDAALRSPSKAARGDGQLEALRGARPAQIHRGRQRAQAGQLQNILQGSAGRFVQIQRGVHPFPIESQLQVVFAVAVDAMCRGIDDHVLDRAQMRVAAQRQRRGRAGELSAKFHRIDRQCGDVDARYGHGAAAGRVGRRFREAFHVDGGGMQGLDLDTARQQCHGRPVDRHLLGGEPNTAIIAELQAFESQSVRKRTVQSR